MHVTPALYWIGGGNAMEELRHIARYPVWRAKVSKFRSLRALQRRIGIRHSIAHFKPDVVHVHVDALFAAECLQAAPQMPCVFTAWGHIPAGLLNSSFGAGLKGVSGLTSDSQPILNEMSRIPGCEAVPQHLFRFGVDRELFKRVPDPAPVYKEIGVPASARIVFSPRSLRPQYNHEILARAMPIVLEHVPDVYFLFTNNHGSRYPEAAAYIENLKTQLSRIGVLDNARFVEHIPHDRMPHFYSAAAVAVSIPLEDGFAATILEAMACETPLVTSRLPDYDGVLTDANAILVDPTSQEEVAAGIVQLLLDRERRAEAVSKGVLTVQACGSLDTEMSRLVEFYSSVIQRSRDQARSAHG